MFNLIVFIIFIPGDAVYSNGTAAGVRMKLGNGQGFDIEALKGKGKGKGNSGNLKCWDCGGNHLRSFCCSILCALIGFSATLLSIPKSLTLILPACKSYQFFTILVIFPLYSPLYALI